MTTPGDVTRMALAVTANAETVKAELIGRLKRIETLCSAEKGVSEENKKELTSLAEAFLKLGDSEMATAALWVREAKWRDQFTPHIVWTSSGSDRLIRMVHTEYEGGDVATWIKRTTNDISALHGPIYEDYRRTYEKTCGYRGLSDALWWAKRIREEGHELSDYDLQMLRDAPAWAGELTTWFLNHDAAELLTLLKDVKFPEREPVAVVLGAFKDAVSKPGSDVRHLPYALKIVRSGIPVEHSVAWIKSVGDSWREWSDDDGAPIHLMWDAAAPPTPSEAAKAWYEETRTSLESLLGVINQHLADMSSPSNTSCD